MRGNSFLAFTGGPGRGLVSFGLMGGVVRIVVCFDGEVQVSPVTGGSIAQLDAITGGVQIGPTVTGIVLQSC